MKSNREAKRLLGIIGKISNRKKVIFQRRDYSSYLGWRNMAVTVKRSSSQNRARKWHKQFRESSRVTADE
ncbi:ribosome hibernation factor SRA [Yersinia proxima]|uniref:ribosome hibernation factor SRA n=1 Tax=Yersinia proxima TaxID=2890316 RepID=UPI003D6903C1